MSSYCIYYENTSGGLLSSIISAHGALSKGIVLNYAKQILEGLVYLHSNGILHGSLRGENILVSSEGKCKIADFGMAVEVQLTASIKSPKQLKVIAEKSAWLAPEVLFNKPFGRKIDVWSFGCLLVEMLTGEKPWNKCSFNQILMNIQENKNCIPSEIDEDLAKILEKCFEYDYEKRPSAQELLELLDNL